MAVCVCVRREGEESHKQHTLTFECTFHTQTKMIMLCTFQLWVICCGNSCGIPYTYEYFVCWIYRLPQLKFPFPSHKEPKTMDKMWLFWNKNPTKLWQLNCAMQYYVSQFQIVYTRILSLPPAPTIPAKCFNFPDYLLNALYTHTHTHARSFSHTHKCCPIRSVELMRFVLSPPWFRQTIALSKNVQFAMPVTEKLPYNLHFPSIAYTHCTGTHTDAMQVHTFFGSYAMSCSNHL